MAAVVLLTKRRSQAVASTSQVSKTVRWSQQALKLLSNYTDPHVDNLFVFAFQESHVRETIPDRHELL